MNVPGNAVGKRGKRKRPVRISAPMRFKVVIDRDGEAHAFEDRDFDPVPRH